VDEYLESVVCPGGDLHVAFNATGPRAAEYGNGKPVTGFDR
jgi:hypothetical protein